jgi:hypothetical protein
VDLAPVGLNETPSDKLDAFPGALALALGHGPRVTKIRTVRKHFRKTIFRSTPLQGGTARRPESLHVIVEHFQNVPHLVVVQGADDALFTGPAGAVAAVFRHAASLSENPPNRKGPRKFHKSMPPS